MNSITLSKSDLQRFWSKVNKNTTTGCWEWSGANNGRGYGKFHIGGEGNPQRYAHRISWIIANGDIPKGLWILHKCDNPKCVNPNHMFLGTQTDNMQDAASKGRIKGGARGEAAGKGKLKEVDVLNIKQLLSQGNVQQVEIARMYNVTPTAILLIKKGKNWSWLNT
jgi:hypothetical protein